jgi:uncharacterized protein YdcH (DUF465 family)
MERNAQEEIKAHLMQSSEEFRNMADQHLVYKKLVAELESKPFLTEEEELEEQRLKKLKLRLKDQMEELLSQYRAQHFSTV